MKKYILIIALFVTSSAFSQGYKKNVYNVGENVGIRTTSPSEKLEVVGNGLFSGDVTGNSFIKSGGLVTEFLKADGSISLENAISITASQVSDFDTEVSNNTEVLANTDKITNATHTGEVTGATALTVASNVIDKDNLAVALKTKVALGDVSGTVNIDTSLGIHFTMNMINNITSLTFSNLTNEELKTITLQITGNFTIAQPSTVKGDWTGFDGTKTNQIQIYLFDITTPVFTSALLNW